MYDMPQRTMAEELLHRKAERLEKENAELKAENRGLRIFFEILLEEMGGSYTFTAKQLLDAPGPGSNRVLVRQDNPEDGSIVLGFGEGVRFDADES